MSTGGVFIGGGIAPKILPALTDGRFLHAFLDKAPLRELLAHMPVHIILNAEVGPARCGGLRGRSLIKWPRPAGRPPRRDDAKTNAAQHTNGCGCAVSFCPRLWKGARPGRYSATAGTDAPSVRAPRSGVSLLARSKGSGNHLVKFRIDSAGTPPELKDRGGGSVCFNPKKKAPAVVDATARVKLQSQRIKPLHTIAI